MESSYKFSEKWGYFDYNLWEICMLSCETSILAALVRPDLPHASRAYVLWEYTKELYSLIITFAGNWQWRLPMTPTELNILLVTLFTWFLKVRFSSSVKPRNLTVETFVRIDSRILMSNAFFWLEITKYEVLNTFKESLLVLCQLLFTVAWTLLMSLSDVKTVVSSAKEQAHLVWGSMHVIDIQNEKYCEKHRALWNTQCNVWHRGAGVFDWDKLFPTDFVRIIVFINYIGAVQLISLLHVIIMYISINNSFI